MEMDINKQPGIEFKKIILIEEKFRRLKIIPDGPHIIVELNFGLEEIIDTSDFQIDAKVVLKCDEKENDIPCIEMYVNYMGIFSYIENEKNMDIRDFAQKSAPAIMFPYIREHITAVSVKAGLKPIILRPINVFAHIDENNDD